MSRNMSNFSVLERAEILQQVVPLLDELFNISTASNIKDLQIIDEVSCSISNIIWNAFIIKLCIN